MSDTATEQFAQRLRMERQARGLTQSRLARLLDIEQGTISKWENGGTLTPANVFHIERTLDLDPGSLSRSLGYVPVGAEGVPSVPDAIAADSELSDASKGVLLAVWTALVSDARSHQQMIY